MQSMLEILEKNDDTAVFSWVNNFVTDNHTM